MTRRTCKPCYSRVRPAYGPPATKMISFHPWWRTDVSSSVRPTRLPFSDCIEEDDANEVDDRFAKTHRSCAARWHRVPLRDCGWSRGGTRQRRKQCVRPPPDRRDYGGEREQDGAAFARRQVPIG